MRPPNDTRAIRGPSTGLRCGAFEPVEDPRLDRLEGPAEVLEGRADVAAYGIDLEAALEHDDDTY